MINYIDVQGIHIVCFGALHQNIIIIIPHCVNPDSIAFSTTRISCSSAMHRILKVLLLARLASAAPAQCTDTSCLEKVAGSWFGACKSCHKGCRIQVTLFGNKCYASCQNGLDIYTRVKMTFHRLGRSNINLETQIQRRNRHRTNYDGALFCVYACRRVS